MSEAVTAMTAKEFVAAWQDEDDVVEDVTTDSVGYGAVGHTVIRRTSDDTYWMASWRCQSGYHTFTEGDLRDKDVIRVIPTQVTKTVYVKYRGDKRAVADMRSTLKKETP